MGSKGEYAIGHANHENFLGIYNTLGFRAYSDSMLSRGNSGALPTLCLNAIDSEQSFNSHDGFTRSLVRLIDDYDNPLQIDRRHLGAPHDPNHCTDGGIICHDGLSLMSMRFTRRCCSLGKPSRACRTTALSHITRSPGAHSCS
jgi:hypothetical protein